METLLPNRFTIPSHRIQLPSAKAFPADLGAALQIVLYGVVTEICVASAARNLLERGHKLALVAHAVRALDAHKAASFVKELLRAGK